MKNFTLWVRYISATNNRQYEKHISIKANDIYHARLKAESKLMQIDGDITAEQLYHA